MGLNVGDTGTAEPGGKERLTGTHRRMVSRLLIEAKFNTALNFQRFEDFRITVITVNTVFPQQMSFLL